ncbi:MAG TPA: STAS domain-containing protein [Mycobacteriales bacterium]|nr:STAS domain-containing protein [Mycobacteriales bacterium]
MTATMTRTDTQVEVLVYGHEAVVTPAGDLDFGTERVVDKVLTALAGLDVHVTVDLAQVEFVDSWTVALMQRAGCDVTESGRTFQLVDATPFVRQIFSLLGADYLFA